MKAKVIKQFRGVIDGQVYPVTFGVGQIIEGSLAESAIGGGYAKSIGQAPMNAALGGPPETFHYPDAPQGADRDDSGERTKPKRGRSAPRGKP